MESESINPYQSPAAIEAPTSLTPVRVDFNLMDILRRAARLLSRQYWIFFAFTVLSLFAASFVPFGILIGPVLVGLFLCLKQCERGQSFDLHTLLKGFDSIVNSLIVMIASIVVNFVLTAPLVVVFLVVFLASFRPGSEPNPWLMGGGIVTFVIVANMASMLAHLPFLFCFQLIADRNVTAIDAIKLSASAVWRNLGNLIALSFVGVVLSLVCTLMCFLPLLFFMPYWIAVMFVAYRQVFPAVVGENPPVAATV